MCVDGDRPAGRNHRRCALLFDDDGAFAAECRRQPVAAQYWGGMAPAVEHGRAFAGNGAVAGVPVRRARVAVTAQGAEGGDAQIDEFDIGPRAGMPVTPAVR